MRALRPLYLLDLGQLHDISILIAQLLEVRVLERCQNAKTAETLQLERMSHETESWGARRLEELNPQTIFSKFGS